MFHMKDSKDLARQIFKTNAVIADA